MTTAVRAYEVRPVLGELAMQVLSGDGGSVPHEGASPGASRVQTARGRTAAMIPEHRGRARPPGESRRTDRFVGRCRRMSLRTTLSTRHATMLAGLVGAPAGLAGRGDPGGRPWSGPGRPADRGVPAAGLDVRAAPDAGDRGVGGVVDLGRAPGGSRPSRQPGPAPAVRGVRAGHGGHRLRPAVRASTATTRRCSRST